MCDLFGIRIKKFDFYKCQCCGDNKGGSLCAHHLESYRNNPDLRTSLENGTTLCEKCYRKFHNQYGYRNNTREQFEEFLFSQKKICHNKEVPDVQRMGGGITGRNDYKRGSNELETSSEERYNSFDSKI